MPEGTTPDEDARPDPEALLIAAAREGKGRLKVFLGAAPGVGKTWEMLAAARRLKAEGRDVVIGLIETHGRAETAAEIGDLPVLARLRVPYRGQTLEEFDADAALARRPGLLLVDELAHTNAPGSRHHKRWEDLAELLEAGVDVWTTLNVQHLESLNDDIARITGVRVAETLPDRVLEIADAIEFIDLSPADLRARLQEGRVYRPDVASRALEGFFREGNLAALREIGLRQAAARVDRDVRDYMRQKAIPGPWPAGERVLALVGDDPTAEAVVRQAKRLADALYAPWIALHVERPDRERPNSAEITRPALDMAAALGAEVETRAGGDLVRATLDAARRKNATHLVIGRARPSFWRRLSGRTLAAALVRQGGAFALHVVPSPGAQPRAAATTVAVPVGAVPWLAAIGLVGLVIAAGEAFSRWLEHEVLGMLFLAAVVGAAALYGLAVALFAAVLSFVSWNMLFIPPLYRLTINEPRDVVAIFVFAGVAVATGWLASRVRAEATTAQGRIESLRRIVDFSRRLGEPMTEPEMHQEVARQAAAIAGRAMVLTPQSEDELNIRAAFPEAASMDEGSWAAARWCWARHKASGGGTATLPSSPWRFIPMQTTRGMAAVLGVRSETPLGGTSLGGTSLGETEMQALTALADQGAAAVERVRLAAEAAQSQAQAETQKLRTALLNSLSHDLRTPLTGIRGAAGTLRTAWERLGPETRADLLDSIEQDTLRMTRFLSNITAMTRLESGEIVPRRERLAVEYAVQAAIARVPALAGAETEIPPGLPYVQADLDLLEQALVNLLENAAKYNPPGAPVRVAAEALGGPVGGPAGGQVRIAVIDQGPGIAAHDLPYVFDSFYRALSQDRTQDRTTPGTGLGLAIARGLVEAMGGSVTAASPRPGAPPDGPPGTEVSISLPIAP